MVSLYTGGMHAPLLSSSEDSPPRQPSWYESIVNSVDAMRSSVTPIVAGSLAVLKGAVAVGTVVTFLPLFCKRVTDLYSATFHDGEPSDENEPHGLALTVATVLICVGSCVVAVLSRGYKNQHALTHHPYALAEHHDYQRKVPFTETSGGRRVYVVAAGVLQGVGENGLVAMRSYWMLGAVMPQSWWGLKAFVSFCVALNNWFYNGAAVVVGALPARDAATFSAPLSYQLARYLYLIYYGLFTITPLAKLLPDMHLSKEAHWTIIGTALSTMLLVQHLSRGQSARPDRQRAFVAAFSAAPLALKMAIWLDFLQIQAVYAVVMEEVFLPKLLCQADQKPDLKLLILHWLSFMAGNAAVVPVLRSLYAPYYSGVAIDGYNKAQNAFSSLNEADEAYEPLAGGRVAPRTNRGAGDVPVVDSRPSSRARPPALGTSAPSAALDIEAGSAASTPHAVVAERALPPPRLRLSSGEGERSGPFQRPQTQRESVSRHSVTPNEMGAEAQSDLPVIIEEATEAQPPVVEGGALAKHPDASHMLAGPEAQEMHIILEQYGERPQVRGLDSKASRHSATRVGTRSQSALAMWSPCTPRARGSSASSAGLEGGSACSKPASASSVRVSARAS